MDSPKSRQSEHYANYFPNGINLLIFVTKTRFLWGRNLILKYLDRLRASEG
jgi:hypothetical protein